MSTSRAQQQAGGASSSGTPSTNGSSAGNVVPSRALTAAGDGPLSSGEGPLSSGEGPLSSGEGPVSVPVLAAVQQASRGGSASLSRPSPSSSGSGKKRSLQPVPLYPGLLHSYEDKSNDFVW